MDKDADASNEEVADLIEEIRQAGRLHRALPDRRIEGAEGAIPRDGSGPLDSCLAELARRSHPRTELPFRFRRFPLTFPPLRKLALGAYNLLTREQRAGNILFRDGLHALQARLSRNEKALRETAVLTDYVRALAMRGHEDRVPETQEEAALATSAEMDSFFVALGNQFRGSADLIKERLRVYPPMIRAAALAGPALDLGCGRGEWLELMREANIESIGVELNPILAASCRTKNLNVIEADFMAFLAQTPPEHWSIVTGFHVIEHLGWPRWYDCVRDIYRALRPGGMLILETPNPANLLVATNFFYRDPTHRQPLPDALLAFAARSVGFASVEILPLHPLVDAEDASGAGPLVTMASETDTARAMTGPQDYALVARK